MEALDLQQHDYDCGPAALRAALQLYGRQVQHADLCRWAGTTAEKGTSAAGLKRALEHLAVPFSEYQSRSRSASWAWARRQTSPVVLCFDADQHWVLLMAGLGRRVLIFDPELGVRVQGRASFLKRWVTDGRVYGISLRRC